MRKSISVYSHESNPAIDPPAYHVTAIDAAERLTRGYVRFLSHNSIQLKAPPDYVPAVHHTGLLNEVWQPRPSAHFIVMQMVPCPTMSEQ